MHEIQGTRSPFDEIRRVDEHGEHWTGRDLAPLMQYVKWENFAAIIEKAKASLAIVQGDEQANHHFLISGSDGGRWGNQPRGDYRLTRFGAYLVAMAGDDTKRAVAEARIYFAVRTREAEISTTPTRQLPRSYAEALRELAGEVEAREAAEAQVAELEPRAHSWDVLAAADGDLAVADAAKLLSRDPSIQLGEQRLFTILGENGWIFRQRSDNRWRIYQSAVDRGWLMPLPQSHYHPRTGRLVSDPPQVRVTLKGLHELHRRLGGSMPLQLPLLT